MLVTGVADASGRRVDIGQALPSDAVDVINLWAESYRQSPTGPVTLTVVDRSGAAPRQVTLERPAVWSLGWDMFSRWFWEFHGAPLDKHLVYTLASLLIVALGARGITATLMTLAFLFMAATDTGPLMGAEWRVPVLGPFLLGFTWMLMAVAIPTIGLAVLYFPSRSPLLGRHRWIAPSLWLVSVPLGLIGGLSTAHLLGLDAAAPAVAWLALRPWVFNLAWAIGLAGNIAIVFEAVLRYKRNPDSVERRRIKSVLVTGVPGMLAYVLMTAVPIGAASLGMHFRWPWAIAVVLETIVLLSAFGLAYAVAVRRAMSPRTALRQGLQYALARKTLGVLTALPVVLLVAALIRQSDQPLSEIVLGQPLFYLGSLVLIALGLRYRDAAQKWLDRRFFRSDYDAKEILLSLASRVPHETDPRALLSLVLSDVESALHPSSMAVLAENGGIYEVVEARHQMPTPLTASSGLAQLLQWSDAPLEIFLNDPRSAIGRLPASDRDWLREAGAALLVPVLAGTTEDRPLVGFILLGPKRSEESYTKEDRRMLAGIAAQMGLALDLSRLRRQAAATPRGLVSPAPEAPTLGTPVSIDLGATIDGKYRVDALIGRGGMGAVYRARDMRLDRDVAVKVVRGELVSSVEARERFKREAQLAARLQHPSIVTVFDYGTLSDGSAYLVMEFVRGEDLRARLARGALDRKDAVRLLAAVADGVAAAHREQILHRDLKPENVLLPESGGPPKVLDFGVAKMMAGVDSQGTVTAGATIVGTPAYMAPEQIRGGSVDPRTDVYSLAVMAHEMLTGRLPFGAGSFVDVAVRQQSDEPLLEASSLPERMTGVLRRALSFQPSRRPDTAIAFAAELRQALGEN
jgi:GAF domain-containing protein/predicted Ser/Thr protein kinase